MINSNERYNVRIGRAKDNEIIVALDRGVERTYIEIACESFKSPLDVAKDIISLEMTPQMPKFEGYRGREGVIPANRDFVRAVSMHYSQLKDKSEEMFNNTIRTRTQRALVAS